MPPTVTDLELPHPPEKVVELLETSARRGKLPGFERGTGGHLFKVSLFSEPFDHDLIARVAETDGGSTHLRFEVRLRGMMPIVTIVVVALTIWPGVWLTHSLLITYFETYRGWCESVPGLTYWWYLPLAIIPLPWAYRTIRRKVRQRLDESITKQIAAIRDAAGSS